MPEETIQHTQGVHGIEQLQHLYKMQSSLRHNKKERGRKGKGGQVEGWYLHHIYITYTQKYTTCSMIVHIAQYYLCTGS